MSFFHIILALLALIVAVYSFEQFNDNVLFGITWAGPVSLREGQVTEVLCLNEFITVTRLKRKY